MLPFTTPVVAGVNMAVTTADCPGSIIEPVDKPLALKPAPDTLTFEIVTLALPVFIKVRACWLLLDTLTSPKFKVNELAFRMYVPFTVKIAGLLTTFPTLLLTTTLNCEPLSPLAVAGVVYVDDVAPFIGTPFRCH
jgi:hypothetical protein